MGREALRKVLVLHVYAITPARYETWNFDWPVCGNSSFAVNTAPNANMQSCDLDFYRGSFVLAVRYYQSALFAKFAT